MVLPNERVELANLQQAGGKIGRHIAEQLLQTKKHVLTAITRVHSTSDLPVGLHVSRVDYDDPNTLVQALQGQQVLIITMAVTAHANMTILIQAAAKAGVSYVLPNWYGHDAANDSLCNDSLLTTGRDNIIAQFKELSVSSYLFLVCNFWYEFSLAGGPDRFGFDFNNRRLILFDDGMVPINTSTWPMCGKAIASLLSLKELPDDEDDQSPTLSQFRGSSVYISSFRLSQRDMFESVKRVTKTNDSDWKISHESSEHRWQEANAAVKQGNFGAFTKQLYSRMFFPTHDGDYESKRGLDNSILGLPVEDLDKFTAIAIIMGENNEVAWGH